MSTHHVLDLLSAPATDLDKTKHWDKPLRCSDTRRMVCSIPGKDSSLPGNFSPSCHHTITFTHSSPFSQLNGSMTAAIPLAVQHSQLCSSRYEIGLLHAAFHGHWTSHGFAAMKHEDGCSCRRCVQLMGSTQPRQLRESFQGPSRLPHPRADLAEVHSLIP